MDAMIKIPTFPPYVLDETSSGLFREWRPQSNSYLRWIMNDDRP
jgi:hypothetical protein